MFQINENLKKKMKKKPAKFFVLKLKNIKKKK